MATNLLLRSLKRPRVKVEDKVIYLQVSADNDEEVNPCLWYVIEEKPKGKDEEKKQSSASASVLGKKRKREDQEEEETSKDLGKGDRIRLLSSIPQLPYTKKVYMARMVALNSRIYLVGGMRCSSFGSLLKRVYYIDTERPHEGWRRGPSLETARCLTYPVALNDINGNGIKIYVMGPRGYPHNCWAEILDPSSDEGKGRTLCHIPSWLHDVGPVTMHAIFDQGRKIFLHSSITGHAFWHDIVRNSWSLIDKRFGRWLGRAATAHGYLFAYGSKNCRPPCTVHACRVSTGSWLSIPVMGFKKDGVEHPTLEFDETGEGTANLFHINHQKLALVWSQRLWDQRSSKFVVHCVKFKIRKCFKRINQRRQSFFRAHVLSAGACIVEGALLVDCITMGIQHGKEGNIVREEEEEKNEKKRKKEKNEKEWEKEGKKRKQKKGKATGRVLLS